MRYKKRRVSFYTHSPTNQSIISVEKYNGKEMNTDEKFILQLSSRFLHLKKTRTGAYSCRCVFCGDSSKSYKRSGNFYPKGDTFNYICFHKDCNKRISLKNLLKELEPELYKMYMEEWGNENSSSSSWDDYNRMQEAERMYRSLSTPHSFEDLRKHSQEWKNRVWEKNI